MLHIDYMNAPAGAGKTYGATSYMKERVAQGEKFILVQPITRLIGETVETTFARQGIDPTVVTEISERTRAVEATITNLCYARAAEPHVGIFEPGSPFSMTGAAMPDPRRAPVLVVDDVPMIRAVVRAVFSQIGVHDVHEAPDGAAALAMLNERSYGLVISDWNMLPMTGLELLRHLREDPRLRETPFVMMTTKEQAHAFTAAWRAGVNACLIKPFMPAALRKVIKNVWPTDRMKFGERDPTTTILL